jgi:hypothetical protein
MPCPPPPARGDRPRERVGNENRGQVEPEPRREIWIEWGGKLPNGKPRLFGPYSSWDDAKRDGFKEPKE